REAVRHIPSGAVDEEGDWTVVVVGELAQALDGGAGCLFFDVSDQVDVAEPIGLLLAELRADRVDELGDHAIAQVTHQKKCNRGGKLSRRPGRNRMRAT